MKQCQEQTSKFTEERSSFKEQALKEFQRGAMITNGHGFFVINKCSFWCVNHSVEAWQVCFEHRDQLRNHQKLEAGPCFVGD